MRIFLAIVAGVIAALVTQSAVDLLASQIYPAAITDMWDRRQVAEAFAARPTGALLLNVLGFFLGALAGSLVAKLLSHRAWTVWVPAGLLAVMALAIAFSFPLPAWTLFANFAASLIAGMIANHLVAARAPAAPVETVETAADA